jgi:hypothetical protein
MHLLAALFILLLLAVLLLLPLHISLSLEKDGPNICGFYSIAFLGLTLKRGDLMPGRGEEKAKKGEIPAFSMGIPKDPRAFIEALPAIIRILKGALGAVRAERLSCRVAFGLSDPADTAFYSGYLWSLAAALRPLGAAISVEPCFEEARLDGSLGAELRIRPLGVLLPLIGALRERSIRSLIKEMRGRDGL